MDEAQSGPRGLFPPTSYSLLGRAGDSDPEQRRAQLEELVRRYLTPLRVHLRTRWRLDPDRVDDALQGFLADCLLKRDLVGGYRATRGRFRTYLVTALDRYVISSVFRVGKKDDVSFPRRRWESGGTEPPGRDSSAGGPDEFDVAWALDVAASVLGRMRLHCLEADQGRIWAVFVGRLLAPALWGEPEVPYEVLADRLGFSSAKHAADALTTAKRSLRAILPAVMQQYVADAEELPDMLDELIDILARCGAERTRGLRILLGPQAGELTMVQDQGDSIRPALLAQLLGSEERIRPLWGPEELSILLRHLLATPVQFYLGDLAPDLARRLRHSTRDAARPITSLGDLLRDPAPDADLLDVIKRFARAQRQNPDSPLPQEIAAVVYYLCIAVASLRSGRVITALAPAELRRGLAWAGGLSWIGPEVASLLREHLEHLDARA